MEDTRTVQRSGIDEEIGSRFLGWARLFLLWIEPGLGWLIFILSLFLVSMPGQAAEQNEWIQLQRSSGPIIILGPLALIVMWWLLGWKRAIVPRIVSRLRVGVLWMSGLLLGLIAWTQAMTGWLPDPLQLVQTALAGAWPGLANQMQTDLQRLGTRYVVWWQGVQAGGATQDDLVFAGFVGAVLWLSGLATGWLIRRYRNGLLAALPSLWLLTQAMLYGTSGGRTSLIIGLTLAIAIHVLLHQRVLERQWAVRRVSHGTGLLFDRALYALGAGFVIMTLAAIIPSIAVEPVAVRYYQLIAPVNDRAEALGERLFPEMKASSRFRGSPVAGGLPNSFLLGTGPELSQQVVMRVRTDDTVFFEPEYLEEVPSSPGHYMRGGTFSAYNGLGWSNPDDLARNRQLAGDSTFTVNMTGRKVLRQDVFPAVTSQAIYAAPEPIEPALDYRVDLRADGDIVAIWARASSYTVASAIPAVSEGDLEAAVGWSDENPLPSAYELHLALPDTITERTLQLAQELTAGLEGPYAKARALELYLRTLEYDLAVPKPPNAVTDVADYFLFELQRGYCDYYATAFTVMARSLGLPTRFATGFAVGNWSSQEGMWVITEAEAHSWPEVYFPDYGWIPFEPTAGRPELLRIGLPTAFDVAGGAPAVAPNPADATEETDGIAWNWQMLVWLIPLGLLAWGGFQLIKRWLPRQDDPWLGLQRWGQRIGRPLLVGETVLEYGSNLATHTLNRYATREQDTGRTIAREVEALSEDVSMMRYGQEDHRLVATQEAQQRWQRLRGYLRRVRLS